MSPTSKNHFYNWYTCVCNSTNDVYLSLDKVDDTYSSAKTVASKSSSTSKVTINVFDPVATGKHCIQASTVCTIFFINKVAPLISTKQPVAVKSSPLECTASDSTATGTFPHVMQKTL